MATRPGDARDAREQAAAGWAAALDAGPLPSERAAALEAWLAVDPRHRGALIRAQAGLAALSVPVPTAPHRLARPGRRAVLAAGGLVCAGALGLMALWPTSPLETVVGEIRQVPLADGSGAVLDTATRLRPRFSATRRDVQLDRGRALFRVAHDPARPFVVEADGISVRAVGTAFSVYRSETVAVVVTEGVVEVTGGARTVTLRAGQGGQFRSGEAATPEPLSAADLARALDWRDGRLELQGETLASAVVAINRYSRRPIVVADAALAGEPLHGAFRTDDPEGFARLAATSLGARVRADRERIVIDR